jgi:hypothetical protein
MKIKVIKSLPEETIFTKGKVFRITPQGIVYLNILITFKRFRK